MSTNTVQTTRRWKKQHGLRSNQRVPDPTSMEIQRRAALIRATWDPITRLKRAGLLPEDLEAPIPRVLLLGLSSRHRPGSS